MSKNTTLKTFGLHGTKKGTISVSDIQAPYGEGSTAVVSIGISLKGDSSEPDWKAHIPYENLDELLEALNEAKALQSK